MTPRFFIDRPVFSWVIALSILFAGFLALRSLPIEQYPTIAPPSLTISAFYPGADASVLATNVTQPIEQELNGVEGFQYMSSSSQSNGTASIAVTFHSGTDINVALVDVQNRLRRVEARLPEDVRRQGVQVVKANAGLLMIVALTSKSRSMQTLELGNFAVARVVDGLRRVPGVGDVRSFSSEYAMRIWLDPAKLAAYNLSPSDALLAVQEQNSQSSGGSLGDRPLAEGSELNAAILTQSRFSTPEQFANVILRADPDGSVIRLGDVARVELGAQTYGFDLEMFLFLQIWRAPLLPTIVVPIALGGACLGLWILGFSINVLTLFAMVM